MPGASDGDSAEAATSLSAGEIWLWRSKELGAARCHLRPNEIGRQKMELQTWLWRSKELSLQVGVSIFNQNFISCPLLELQIS